MTEAAPPRSEPPRGGPWDLPLEEAPLVWLDLEMTGLDAEVDRICEIAAVRVRGGEREGELVSLVRAGVPVGGSEAVHGISDAILETAPPLPALAEDLAALLDDAVLVGHAIGWDLAFLEAAARRGELPPPPAHALDTRSLARRCWHRGSYSLASLCEEHGLALPTHRAEADAVAAGALLEVVRRALRADTPRQLLQAQTREPPVRFRDDVHAALLAGLERDASVRFAYRVPGREPFEDELTIRALTPSHVEGHLVRRGLEKTLRGDRMLWAELVP